MHASDSVGAALVAAQGPCFKRPQTGASDAHLRIRIALDGPHEAQASHRKWSVMERFATLFGGLPPASRPGGAP